MSVHEDHIAAEPTPTEVPVAEAARPADQPTGPILSNERSATTASERGTEEDRSESQPQHVDPVRAAAGRLGGQRMHELVRLGLEYEREHGLKVGRQRQRQLIQLGRRYELEHGLAVPVARRRKKKTDAWTEFLTALARVVKPAHRPAVDQLVAALQPPRAVAG